MEKQLKFPTVRKYYERWFKSRCRWRRVGIIALIVLALGWWNLFRERALVISPETTIITQPRTRDGKYVDYTEAIRLDRPREMKTDENAARILVRELRPDMEQTPRTVWLAADDQKAKRIKSAVYRELGLDPDIPETTRLTSFYDDYDAKLREKYPKAQDGSESPEYKELHDRFYYGFAGSPEKVKIDEEFTRDWVARNNEALDIIVAASKAKIYQYPFTMDSDEEWPLSFGLLLPCTQESRNYARSLAFRSAWRVAAGDIDGAIDDIIACRRLGNKLGEHSFCLVETLVGIAEMGIAAGCAPGGNADAEPTREQWQRYYDALASTPNRVDMLGIIDKGERYGGPDIIEHLAAMPRGKRAKFVTNLSGNGDNPLFLLRLVLSFGYDWNTVTREYNRLYDLAMTDCDAFEREMRAHQCENGVWDTAKAVCSIAFRATTMQRRSKMMGQMIAGLLIPAVQAAQEASRRCDCAWQMQKIALAMRLYACDHDGCLPPAYTVDSDGRALHSWRVLLLPYLGYETLYARLRLNEPWNSPHNAQYAADNIAVYRCPTGEKALADGDASYSVVVGPETLFAADGGAGRNVSELYAMDKTRKTPEMYLLVERRAGVNWMKPDAEVTQENALQGPNPTLNGYRTQKDRAPRPDVMGSFHPGGVNVVFYGGNVSFISDSIKQSDVSFNVTGRKPTEEPSDESVEAEK